MAKVDGENNKFLQIQKGATDSMQNLSGLKPNSYVQDLGQGNFVFVQDGKEYEINENLASELIESGVKEKK